MLKQHGGEENFSGAGLYFLRCLFSYAGLECTVSPCSLCAFPLSEVFLLAFNGEKSDCGNTGPAEVSQTIGERVVVVRRGLSEFSVTSGKELISPSMVAATATASPHTAFSPQHVSCLRGLDAGRVGWFGAHGNLFPCLGCEQQSLQVQLHSQFKRFRAELCTDGSSSCEKACLCEG